MPGDYVVGHGKPPRHTQFRKGQSGNPGGRPGIRKTRRAKFAQMVDAAMCESTELVATTPCAGNYAATAKGIALDCVRGKTAAIRLMLFLLDELDRVDSGQRRPRGLDRRLEEMEAAEAASGSEEEAEGSVHPVSQGVIEAEPMAAWSELAGEAARRCTETPPPDMSRPAPAGRPDEAGAREGGNEREFQTPASPLSEGNKQGAGTESERSFLIRSDRMARRKPSEKELRRREQQAEAEYWQKTYERVRATVKAFADKHGYEFAGTQPGEPLDNAPSPLSEGQLQAVISSPPGEGPYTRALREKLVRLAAAERIEDERKAAIAAGVDRRTAALMALGKEADVSPPPNGDPAEPPPLPDYTIWMRGQRAAPP